MFLSTNNVKTKKELQGNNIIFLNNTNINNAILCYININNNNK